MTPVRLLVTGGRDYVDRHEVRRVLSTLPRGSVVIHGGAPGADMLADEEARALGLAVESYPAAWREHAGGWCRCQEPRPATCPMAGPRRNQRQLDDGRPTDFYAFPGGSGTADMVARCMAARVPRWSEADAQLSLFDGFRRLAGCSPEEYRRRVLGSVIELEVRRRRR